jgi:hypothetical protein
MMPAMLEPEAAIPVARAFLVLKYVETMATDGMKRQPEPIPIQRPCARMTCQ